MISSGAGMNVYTSWCGISGTCASTYCQSRLSTRMRKLCLFMWCCGCYCMVCVIGLLWVWVGYYYIYMGYDIGYDYICIIIYTNMCILLIILDFILQYIEPVNLVGIYFTIMMLKSTKLIALLNPIPLKEYFNKPSTTFSTKKNRKHQL